LKTVLITGERGEVGSYVYEKLLAKDDVSVFTLKETLPEKIDAVYHFAAKSPGADFEPLVQSNIIFLKEVAERAEKHQVDSFYFISSVSVFGTVAGEVNEKCSLNNPGIYGLSKLMGEKYIESKPFKSLSVRLPAVLETKKADHLLNRLSKKIRKSEDCKLLNGENEFNFFISLEEVYEFLLSANLKKNSDVVVLSSKKELSLVEICKMIVQEWRSKSNIKNTVNDHASFINSSKAIEQYGFKQANPNKVLKNWLMKVKDNI
jgi:nucleoside-diphosphate-sugar epimerase